KDVPPWLSFTRTTRAVRSGPISFSSASGKTVPSVGAAAPISRRGAASGSTRAPTLGPGSSVVAAAASVSARYVPAVPTAYTPPTPAAPSKPRPTTSSTARQVLSRTPKKYHEGFSGRKKSVDSGDQTP